MNEQVPNTASRASSGNQGLLSTLSRVPAAASGDAGLEIAQILSQGEASEKSPVFGCSPPLRCDNPLASCLHETTSSNCSSMGSSASSKHSTVTTAPQSCGAAVYGFGRRFSEASPVSALGTA